MPPAAALECERTGWTLERIATVAPCSAAARAWGWPASPAPMIRTSCEGMGPPSYSKAPGAPARSAGGECRALERPAHLVERDHAPQATVAVHRQQGPDAAQGLRAQQRLQGLVGRDPPVAQVALHDLAHRVIALAQPLRAQHPLALGQPDEPAVAVHHREPRVLVAQEVFVERAAE